MPGVFSNSSDPAVDLQTDVMPPRPGPEVPGALSPMPEAPGDEAARWLRRMAAGAAIGVAMLVALPVAVVAAWVLGVASPFIAYGLGPLIATAWLVPPWLLTAPEPNAPRRMRLGRWIVRAGALLAAAYWYLLLATGGALPAPPGAGRYVLAAALIVCSVAIYAWAVGAFWHARRLARRLGDVVLRANLTVLTGIFAILTGLQTFMVAAKWHGRLAVVADHARDLFNRPQTGGQLQQLPLSGVVTALGILLYLGWLLWRLGVGLRRAAVAVEADPTTDQPRKIEEPS